MAETSKKTKYLKIDPADPDLSALEEAGRILREGGLVAFPTETVYGLGADAANPGAVAGVFRAKGRPDDNPLIVHIADISQVSQVAEDVTVPARRVMEVFWPGPLTVVLPKKDVIPAEVTAGLDTVAVRMPDHPVAAALLRAAGVPVAAPSANSSGRPSPTTADHVLSDLDGKIDMIIDGGACRVGLESTVLDLTSEVPTILRPGGVARDELEAVLGRVASDPGLEGGADTAPKSPGLKYRHYSPRAELILIAGDDYEKVFEKVNALLGEYRPGRRVGVLASAETARCYSADAVFPAGTRADLATVAKNLFYGLRFLDAQGVDLIIAEGYPEHGIGAAIMNRLKKAAGKIVESGEWRVESGE